MRSSVLGVAAVLVTACSSSTPPPDGGATDSGASDVVASEGGDAGDAGGEYCPAGYTLTPFITQTATTHTFSKADQVADTTKDYVAVLETTAPGRLVWHFRHHRTDRHELVYFPRVFITSSTASPSTVSCQASSRRAGTQTPSAARERRGGRGLPATASRTSSRRRLSTPRRPSRWRTAARIPTAHSSSSRLPTLTQQLQPNYTLFGDLIEGQAVLPLLATSPDPNGATPPANPTVMTDVHICQK